jgi:hypothetical protein
MTMADYKTVDNAAENKVDKPTPTEDFRIIFAMAEASGVTEARLKAALTEKIGATHVEIEDMSGKPPTPHIRLKATTIEGNGRWSKHKIRS